MLCSTPKKWAKSGKNWRQKWWSNGTGVPCDQGKKALRTAAWRHCAAMEPQRILSGARSESRRSQKRTAKALYWCHKGAIPQSYVPLWVHMRAGLALFWGRNSVAMVPFVTVFLSAEDALLQVCGYDLAVRKCVPSTPQHQFL